MAMVNTGHYHQSRIETKQRNAFGLELALDLCEAAPLPTRAGDIPDATPLHTHRYQSKPAETTDSAMLDRKWHVPLLYNENILR